LITASVGLDHDQDPARLLKRGKEFRDGVAAHEVALGTVCLEQRVDLGGRAVVQRDGVPVVGEVARDVGSHHREAGDADLRCSGGCG
jgi:hypothetical protein